MVWPAGMGLNFKGVLDLETDEFVPFRSRAGSVTKPAMCWIPS